jgi:hypothetical protein
MKNLAFGCAAALLLTVAYYREFFLRHSEEIFSQASAGEIDAAGDFTEADNPASFLFYILSIMDSQAGPFIGLGMLFALFWLFYKKRPHVVINQDGAQAKIYGRGISPDDQMLLASMLPAILFFTLIAKKQVFYTIPILVPLAVWLGQLRILSRIAVVGGFLGWLSIGCGIGEIGKPWLPMKWTAPRHTLAKEPTFDDFPLAEAFSDIPHRGGTILVLSQDSRLFEGFLALLLREKFPGRKIRGVALDPEGSVEQFDEVEHFVWVGPKNREWPNREEIRKEVEDDHQMIEKDKAIDYHLSVNASVFKGVGSWPILERGSSNESQMWLYVYRVRDR